MTSIGAPGALATGLGAHGSTHIGTLQTCPQSAHTCSGAARTHPATGARGRPGATRVFARPSLPPAAAARNGPPGSYHMPTRAVALPARSSPAVPPSWRLRAYPLRALPLTAPKRARVTRRHREIAGCCGPARSTGDAEAQACERARDGLSGLCARARSACARFKTVGTGAPGCEEDVDVQRDSGWQVPPWGRTESSPASSWPASCSPETRAARANACS